MGRKKRILRIKMNNDLEYPIEEFTETATRDFDFELISAERKTPHPSRHRQTSSYAVEFLALDEEFVEIEHLFYKCSEDMVRRYNQDNYRR